MSRGPILTGIRRQWFPQEEDRLRELWGDTSTVAIAQMMGRTVSAIHQRAGILGLGRAAPAGSMTGAAFVSVVGLSTWPTFRRWVEDGLLEATRYESYRGTASKRPQWLISEEAVRSFLGAYPWLYDRERVDPAYQQFCGERYITLVQAFRLGAAWPDFLEKGVKAGLIPEVRQRGDKGTRWVVPESILPRLVAGRRTMTDDREHRRLVVAYDRLQRNNNVGLGRRRVEARAQRSAIGGRVGRRDAAA